MKFLVLSLLLITNLFANESYSKENIEKMIAKMVILGFYGTSINQNDEIYKDIKLGLGGVILFDKDPNDKTKVKNIESKSQLKKLNRQLQAVSNEKLLICIDQEGGVVQRLKKESGFVDTLSAKDIAKQGEDFARKSYKALAKDLSSVGINLDFAPSVDLAINKNNKVIVTRGRSYGQTSEVIKYSTIFADELKKQNIIAVLKHFPGHGSSVADSHFGFVDITKTWKKEELEPYKYFIKNGNIDMIMVAHVFNENIDKNYPATLSFATNTKLLQEELGFNGVIVTDDLQMSAISKHYDLKQTLTLAINSGVNMLVFANQGVQSITLKEIIDTVYLQILNKQISLQKIIDSNKKIDKLLKSI